MKTPDFELVDGIFPDQGAYITIEIPHSWLTNEAFDGESDCENYIHIEIEDLIQNRVEEGRCSLSHPNASQAKITIATLRKYADLLEKTFVTSADAIEPGQDDEPIFINRENPEAKIFLTDAETGNLTDRWQLSPCSNGHTDILADNSVVKCKICGEQVSGDWTKQAMLTWNFTHYDHEEFNS